jgi:hypothetical protein
MAQKPDFGYFSSVTLNDIVHYGLSVNSSLSSATENRIASFRKSEVTSICRIWGSHSDGYEEFYLLGYNYVQSVESQPTFRRNISPPSLLATCFHVGFLFGLVFDFEVRRCMFLRNVCWLPVDYTALHPRRYNSSWPWYLQNVSK